MSREMEMIKKKKKQVEQRRKLVRNACEKCIEEGIMITYKEIESRVNIPHKTLERSPYKDDIKYYKNINIKDEIENTEIRLLREQIRYYRELISQLNKENHNLKTELLKNGII